MGHIKINIKTSNEKKKSIKKKKITGTSNSNPILHFLEEHRVGKGAKHTHTSMGKPMGSFYIPSSETEHFYNLYETAIFNKVSLHLLEKHRDVSPIIVDFDYKYEFDIMERQYTIEHINNIIKLYIKEIDSIFNITNKKEELIAFVFERDAPYKYKGNTKDGMHIMFPFIVSEPDAQYLLRDNILKNIAPILDDMPLKISYCDVVDRSVISKNGWFMYGSSKPNNKAYSLTHVFDQYGEEIGKDEVDYKGEKNFAKFLSIRRYTHKNCTHIRECKYAELEKIQKKKLSYKKNRFKRLKSVNYDFNSVKDLVNILSISRADDYEKWIEVAICLNSIDPSNPEMFELWENFSKKSSKYEDGCCEKKWDEIARSNAGRRELTIGTLIFWARFDNYEKFMDLKRKDVQLYIEKSITATNWDIARVLYELLKYQFVYSAKEWYEFKNHRWHRDDEGISLRSNISNDLVREYIKLIEAYNMSAAEAGMDNDAEDKKDEFLRKAKILSDITQKLKTTGFKDNIMKECKELFYDKKFNERLDNDPYLIGFENGIYDLKTMEFRDGRPDDYVSLTTDNDYIDHDEEDNEYLHEIKKFVSTIFPREEIREYVLTMLASYLQGVNAEEKFRIWTGSGSNGKSKLEELFLLAFGEYCIKFPITLLTGKRAASNACTPEVVQSKGKRFGYFEEPGENERINVGLMKEYTGGDKIKARGLHKDPIEFKPQFKLLLLCNELPKVPPDDDGTWRRLEVTEFKSKFVDNPKEDNEYPRDLYLSEKMKEWKETFISWLLEVYYKKYKEGGLVVPKEIIKFTAEYQKNCDVYVEFIDDMMEEGDKGDFITYLELHAEYKVWYADNYNSNKFTTKREFKKYIEKKFKKKNRKSVCARGIRGYRIRDKFTNEEEEENTVAEL